LSVINIPTVSEYAVPADLQVYVGKKELRYSLQTGYLSEAKFKARFYATGVQLLFRRLRELRSMKFNDDQIKEFAKAYFDQQLQKLAAEFRPVTKRKLKGISAIGSAYVSPESLLKSIDSKKLQRRLDLISGNHETVMSELQALLKEHGIDFDDIDQSNPSFTQLCKNLLNARIQALDAFKSKIEGKPVSNDLGTVKAPPISAEPSHKEPVTPATKAVTLKEVHSVTSVHHR
jgi:hypothetical protein